jgi:hypothetical protein
MDVVFAVDSVPAILAITNDPLVFRFKYFRYRDLDLCTFVMLEKFSYLSTVSL